MEGTGTARTISEPVLLQEHKSTAKRALSLNEGSGLEKRIYTRNSASIYGGWGLC
jgi:hypothetical protein